MDAGYEKRVRRIFSELYLELYLEQGWGETAAWIEAYKRADKYDSR